MAFQRRRTSRFDTYGGFAPYVPVAKRRAQAAAAAAKAAKSGASWQPVTVSGRKIAATFWGQAWCEHLESYSDYANRLPRGRTYVRNGAVVDLRITRGAISARVQGSSLYQETITIRPLAAARWNTLKRTCAGQITSLVSLLQGRIPEPVLRAITDRDTGLFPAPGEIQLDCSCPDSAHLCKHLAAVLYGVGARLDAQPELLFLLRGVDHQELISEAVAAATLVPAGPADAAPIDDAELADVFGIDIGDAEEHVRPIPTDSESTPRAAGSTPVHPATPAGLYSPGKPVPAEGSPAKARTKIKVSKEKRSTGNAKKKPGPALPKTQRGRTPKSRR